MKKTDPFSTSVHLDLMSGRNEENELKSKVFSALQYMELCPQEKARRKEILDSYEITEDDVRKYYQEWLEKYGSL
jgi:ribosomal protein L15E